MASPDLCTSLLHHELYHCNSAYYLYQAMYLVIIFKEVQPIVYLHNWIASMESFNYILKPSKTTKSNTSIPRRRTPEWCVSYFHWTVCATTIDQLIYFITGRIVSYEITHSSVLTGWLLPSHAWSGQNEERALVPFAINTVMWVIRTLNCAVKGRDCRSIRTVNGLISYKYM